MDNFTAGQMMQAIERMVQFATVVERAGKNVRVRWSSGGESAWLPLAQLGSASLKFWIPQDAGDQVLVLSPGGDTVRGVVYPGPIIGAAPAGNFSGVISGTGDVVASGVSLVSHVHGGVNRGRSNTDPPS